MSSTTITIPHRFQPRSYQLEALQALDGGIKKAVISWHRGAGKDIFALNYLIKRAVQKQGVYLHCFPNYSQGKRAIWKSVHDNPDGTAMAYLDHIPEQLIKSKNSSEMLIELVNGSIYCVMGLDGRNAARARGMNPNFIILSEYAYMDPEAWMTIEPRISQNNGTSIFLSTPNGQNHFYQLYNYAKSNPKDYYSSLLTIDDTHVLPADHLDKLRAEGWPEDFLQQEYLCSFTRGAEGSYYGKQIQKARDEERITQIGINPGLPCHTSWDIGIGDSTAIWIFQTLDNGKINFIHYFENQGEMAEFYCKYLQNWKERNQAFWGKHYCPFDIENNEWVAGSRIEAIRKLGFNADVVPKHKIDDGINMVRSLLPYCVFDAKECERGVKCLDFYRKKYNEPLKVYYDEPCHDQWSHGADSFRYACAGIKHYGQTSGSMTPDKLMQLKASAGFGPKQVPIQHRIQNPFVGR